MSTEQTRRSLNQLDKELADLEKKLAEEAKKEADKMKRISDIQASITKNTSASSLQSKARQMQNYQSEIAKIRKNAADISAKIANKRKKRADMAVKLQKEEMDDLCKAEKERESINNKYKKQITSLMEQISKQPINPQPLSTLYAITEEEYDVFLSHATEDKESFANEFHDELRKLGTKVWYDDISMGWGDSLRARIDAGLLKSKYGIVVISRDYIRKGWTQYELDGLFQIEMTRGKTILPIWHNITKKEVQDFSPSLAGRLALSSSMFTPQEIAEKLLEVLDRRGSSDE